MKKTFEKLSETCYIREDQEVAVVQPEDMTDWLAINKQGTVIFGPDKFELVMDIVSTMNVSSQSQDCDIVEKLRSNDDELCQEAAKLIEQLREELRITKLNIQAWNKMQNSLQGLL